MEGEIVGCGVVWCGKWNGGSDMYLNRNPPPHPNPCLYLYPFPPHLLSPPLLHSPPNAPPHDVIPIRPFNPEVRHRHPKHPSYMQRIRSVRFTRANPPLAILPADHQRRSEREMRRIDKWDEHSTCVIGEYERR
ncbi:hypothetical protein K458DRAFT_160612 [Lentithecium fluviatile CBS 122367]|uniref:Uncharacterized protein n=1 Tax=Lentithecium fluviatile CBS 122367 TaxID=1168545 RepID=A0A6G1IHP0_9PLEO|nr:hypothetical protein K458DRAFT_160612 [Lentithecium fluviatile CBS 122367]